MIFMWNSHHRPHIIHTHSHQPRITHSMQHTRAKKWINKQHISVLFKTILRSKTRNHKFELNRAHFLRHFLRFSHFSHHLLETKCCINLRDNIFTRVFHLFHFRFKHFSKKFYCFFTFLVFLFFCSFVQIFCVILIFWVFVLYFPDSVCVCASFFIPVIWYCRCIPSSNATK